MGAFRVLRKGYYEDSKKELRWWVSIPGTMGSQRQGPKASSARFAGPGLAEEDQRRTASLKDALQKGSDDLAVHGALVGVRAERAVEGKLAMERVGRHVSRSLAIVHAAAPHILINGNGVILSVLSLGRPEGPHPHANFELDGRRRPERAGDAE